MRCTAIGASRRSLEASKGLLNEVGGQCKSCPEHCNRCVGTGCAECNGFTYLDANQECVERCPEGYFARGVDELGRVCERCSGAHGQQCGPAAVGV